MALELHKVDALALGTQPTTSAAPRRGMKLSASAGVLLVGGRAERCGATSACRRQLVRRRQSLDACLGAGSELLGAPSCAPTGCSLQQLEGASRSVAARAARCSSSTLLLHADARSPILSASSSPGTPS